MWQSVINTASSLNTNLCAARERRRNTFTALRLKLLPACLPASPAPTPLQPLISVGLTWHLKYVGAFYVGQAGPRLAIKWRSRQAKPKKKKKQQQERFGFKATEAGIHCQKMWGQLWKNELKWQKRIKYSFVSLSLSVRSTLSASFSVFLPHGFFRTSRTTDINSSWQLYFGLSTNLTELSSTTVLYGTLSLCVWMCVCVWLALMASHDL